MTKEDHDGQGDGDNGALNTNEDGVVENGGSPVAGDWPFAGQGQREKSKEEETGNDVHLADRSQRTLVNASDASHIEASIANSPTVVSIPTNGSRTGVIIHKDDPAAAEAASISPRPGTPDVKQLFQTPPSAAGSSDLPVAVATSAPFTQQSRSINSSNNDSTPTNATATARSTARSTTTTSNQNENENQSQTPSIDENTAKIAAQMAAVAATATATTDSTSPAAAAQMAQAISATIADLPPPPPPPPPPGGPPGGRKKRRNYVKQRPLVHPGLVRHHLSQQWADILKEHEIDTHDEEDDDDENSDVEDNVSKDDDLGIIPDDPTNSNEGSLVSSEEEEEDHNNDDFNEETNTKNNHTGITPRGRSHPSSPPKLQQQKTSKKSSPILPHVIHSQISSGKNDNFLKYLIILSSYSCLITEEDAESTTPSQGITSSSPTDVPVPPSLEFENDPILAEKEVNDGNNIVTASASTEKEDKVWSAAENQTASQAANQVSSLLDHAEFAFAKLSSLLPNVDVNEEEDDNDDKDPSKSNTTSENFVDIDQVQTNSYMKQSTEDGMNYNDGKNNIDLDDDESYHCEPIRIIPDLLPPCTSKNGDATAIFYRACATSSSSSSSSSSTTTTPTAASGPDSPSRATTPQEANSTFNTKESNSDKRTNSKTKNASNDSTSTSLATSSQSRPNQRVNVASSIMSSVISSVKTSPGGVFSKVRRNRQQKQAAVAPSSEGGGKTSSKSKGVTSTTTSTTTTISKEDKEKPNVSKPSINTSNGSGNNGLEYNVTIEREMLGLTVENVLERTVVRTVLSNGAAKKAGAKVGSLIVKVGDKETANLTHFETIDELRQSKRPLKLVLRRISSRALRGAREEMGRLIRGGGFGVASMALAAPSPRDKALSEQKSMEPKAGETDDEKHMLQKDIFLMRIREQWIEGAKRAVAPNMFNKQDESIAKSGEKLVWILTLLVIGLEREAAKLNAESLENPFDDGIGWGTNSSTTHNTAKDYMDAARSVSKILHDYVQKHFEREKPSDVKQTDPNESAASIAMNRKRNKLVMPPPHILDKQQNAVPGASKRNSQQSGASNNAASSSPTETALLRIGDVLHRARTFLADPYSPPAALLRGEVIALLCEVLDIDVDKTLSEEESNLSMDGDRAGPIHDLGSAGNLLKLIVLNCPVMRSPGCVRPVRRGLGRPKYVDQHKFHAGNRFLAVVHRLAGSRSVSARVTACSLGPVLWGHLDFPHQLQLRGVITRALHDVEVIVRKSTATVLHEIAELVFDSRVVSWLVLMCERAMTDPEPQLRAAAMTLTWHLAEHLPNAFYGDASEGSRSVRRLPPRSDPTYIEVYLLQCKLLPVGTRLAEDRAAPVRLAVAAQCDRLVNAMGEHWYSVIIDILQALLNDEDQTVRGEAVLCMPRLAETVLQGVESGAGPNMSVNVLESLLPITSKLVKDASVEVRCALAAAAGELLTLLSCLQNQEDTLGYEPTSPSDAEIGDREGKGHKKHIDDTLIPLLQTLLHDPVPEVTSAALRAVTNASRGNTREIRRKNSTIGREDDSVSISSHSHSTKEPVFRPVLSEKQVLKLLPTLSKLATSSQWRVRQSAVEIVPALLGCTHRLETRSEIAKLCVTLMSDKVDAVRRTAAECLCLGSSSCGDNGQNINKEWIHAIVLPHIQACSDSNGCKQRLLSLKMVEIILVSGICTNGPSTSENIIPSSLEGDDSFITLSRKVLQISALLAKDKIANVRLNVGRVYGCVLFALDKDDLSYVITVLEDQLENEAGLPGGSDRDVQFFGRRTIKAAKQRLLEFETN